MFDNYIIKIPDDIYYNKNSPKIVLASQFSKYGQNFEYLKYLIDHGANINEKNNNNGWTALIFAAVYSNIYSNLETVKYLIENGAKLYSNKTSSLETVKYLIDHGANINEKNNYGDTALMLAAWYYNKYSNLETVKYLIKSGANINAKNNDGYTALMYIFEEKKDKEIILFMLEYGASIYSTNKNNVLKILEKKYGKKSELYNLVFNFKIIKNEELIDADIKFFYKKLIF